MDGRTTKDLTRFDEAALVGILERMKEKSLHVFGPGDVCDACGVEIEGFGLCADCLQSNGKAACSCQSVKSSSKLRFLDGWHIDGDTTVERCPTYWRDFHHVANITLEKNTIKAGRRLSPGSYRAKTTFRIDPLNRLKLIGTTDWDRIHFSEGEEF